MTVKQRQHLLGYLGYYRGRVDGIWGEQSRAAVLAFQKTRMGREDGAWDTETGDALRKTVGSEAPEDPWQGIRYWKREEFRCCCGSCGGYPAEPDPVLLCLADTVRDHFGRPGIATSGLRCEDHNRRVGGVSNSRHLTGKALDFRIQGKGSAEVLSYARCLPGVRYAYAIDDSHIHMDVE